MYSKDNLLDYLKQDYTLDRLEHGCTIQVGTAVEFTKDLAYFMKSYTDKDGNTVLGNNSQFFVHESNNRKETTLCLTSSVFWNCIKKQYKRLTSDDKEKKVVTLTVSFGHKSVDDTPYLPKYQDVTEIIHKFGNEDGDLEVNLYSEDMEAGQLFSQEADQKLPPPPLPQTQPQRKVRANQTQSNAMVSEYIWKNFSNPEAPLYHALTMEMYKYLKTAWIQFRFDDDRANMMERYPCIPGSMDTWPTIDQLPEEIRQGGPPFCNQFPEKGAYPPERDSMGCYKRFKKTEEEIVLEEKQRQQETLGKLVTALGGNNNKSSHQCANFTVRIQRQDDSNRFFNFVRSINCNETLLDLWNTDDSKKTLRTGFPDSVVTAVMDGKKYLMLSHVNGIDPSRVYNSYPISKLQDYKLSDIWLGLPRDSNGFLDGAVFPVLLLLECMDVPTNQNKTGNGFL